MNLPAGTITFLFTDIEGSTKLWERCPEAMGSALAVHDALLRRVIERNSGYVFKTVGDAFCAAFATALNALSAALEAHLALMQEEWGETGPIRVRMGIHTGDAEIRDSDYFGPTLNRVARLQSIAAGSQTLISQATFELVRDRVADGVTLRPLGLHRLKDLNRAEQVYQATCPGLPAEFPALKSLDSYPNNLPIQLTSFIGRETEIAEIKGQIESHRLVTLLGTGGTGKSRLSLQVGADLLDRFPDGVWFVELASLTDPSLAPQAIGAVIGIKEELGRPLAQTLIENLKQRTAMIILDNCEHLLDACARLTQNILQSCANIIVLATSREALSIPGETIVRVPSLALPDPDAGHTTESLTQFEAVQLFIDRAVGMNAAFTVTNENAPALAHLCVRLDGIPLAIELAAARTRSLSVEEINGKLDNCFRILTGGSRTALPRQQTLRALVDWSYDMLSETEKALLMRISVFRGGWTLEAAEQVCVGVPIEDWEILDLLTGLTDKSLVISEQDQGHTRFRLLETIRQYARDRVVESGDAEALRSRHFVYFHKFVLETSRLLLGAQVQDGLHGLRSEIDNVRSALHYGIETRAAETLQMAADLGSFWYLGGYLREGRECLEQALRSSIGQPRDLEGEACFEIGKLAVEQGDYGPAREYLERSLALSVDAGNKSCAASALNSLGAIAFRNDDCTQARFYFERSLALYKELGNQRGTALALDSLGSVFGQLGDLECARSYHEQSLAVQKTLGNQRGIVNSLYNLGNVCFEEGDAAGARSHFEQCLAIAQELNDDWYAAWSQICLADLLKAESNYHEARSLAQQGLSIVRRIGDQFAIAMALAVLGEIACAENEVGLARSLFTECMAIRRKLGQTRGIAEALEGFSVLALVSARLDAASPAKMVHTIRAARLLAAADAHRNSLGTPMEPTVVAKHRSLLAELHGLLTEEAFEAAWSDGAALDLEHAVDYALEQAERK